MESRHKRACRTEVKLHCVDAAGLYSLYVYHFIKVFFLKKTKIVEYKGGGKKIKEKAKKTKKGGK